MPFFKYLASTDAAMREEARGRGSENPELTAYRVDAHTRLRLAVVRKSCNWCLDEIHCEINRTAHPEYE